MASFKGNPRFISKHLPYSPLSTSNTCTPQTNQATHMKIKEEHMMLSMHVVLSRVSEPKCPVQETHQPQLSEQLIQPSPIASFKGNPRFMSKPLDHSLLSTSKGWAECLGDTIKEINGKEPKARVPRIPHRALASQKPRPR